MRLQLIRSWGRTWQTPSVPSERTIKSQSTSTQVVIILWLWRKISPRWSENKSKQFQRDLWQWEVNLPRSSEECWVQRENWVREIEERKKKKEISPVVQSSLVGHSEDQYRGVIPTTSGQTLQRRWLPGIPFQQAEGQDKLLHDAKHEEDNYRPQQEDDWSRGGTETRKLRSEREL